MSGPSHVFEITGLNHRLALLPNAAQSFHRTKKKRTDSERTQDIDERKNLGSSLGLSWQEKCKGGCAFVLLKISLRFLQD